MKHLPHACLLAALVFATGCSSRVAPVSGHVTLNGNPLAHATVVFEPDSDQPNPGPGSAGKTDAQGHYTLQLMTGDTKGALIGRHKVSITAYEGAGDVTPSSGSDIVFRKALVPHEYNVHTTLTFDVPPAGTDKADFPLKTKAK